MQRGGKVIDSKSPPSKQFDVILTSRNTLRVFREKGLYPIETVAALFSITSSLRSKKLEEEIEGLASLPSSKPDFLSTNGLIDLFDPLDARVTRWRQYFPYSCVFGFDGTLGKKWEKRLNEMSGFGTAQGRFPDLVVINKKEMFVKVPHETTEGRLYHYEYRNFMIDKGAYFTPLSIILNELHKRASWQLSLFPSYVEYFRQDVPEEYRYTDSHGQSPSEILAAMYKRLGLPLETGGDGAKSE